MEKCHDKRVSYAAGKRAIGWDAARVERAISILINLQQQEERQFGRDKYFFEEGGLDNYLCLFFTKFIPVSLC